jgi:hypothetical protein
MVRESGLDAAEAKPKESEHVAAPRTDAANKTDLQLFMRSPFVFGLDSVRSPGESPLGAPVSFGRSRERCQRRLSALLHRGRKRKTFRDIVGDQGNCGPAACHRELPNPRIPKQSVLRRENHGSRHVE